MATESMDSTATAPGGVRGDVVGGAVVAVLGLLHLFLLQVGGILGWLLLFVVWPLVGGAVAAFVEDRRTGSVDPTVGPLAGVFGSIVVSLLVLLTGLVGLWSGFIVTNIGVSLWPVFFAVLVSFTVLWTVFGYVGGYATRTVLQD